MDSRVLLSTTSGTVYFDANGNGSQGGGESAYTSATLLVYADNDNSHTFSSGDDSTTTTSMTGAYSLTTTGTGMHDIIVQSNPTDDGHPCTQVANVDVTTNHPSTDLGLGPIPIPSITLSHPTTGRDSEIDVSWAGGISGYSGFSLQIGYRVTGGSTYTPLGSSFSYSNSHAVTGLSAETQYDFEAYVVSSPGVVASYPHVFSSSPMYTAPAPPTSFSASGYNTQVNMTWSNPASYDIVIEHSIDGGSTFSTVNTGASSPLTYYTDTGTTEGLNNIYHVRTTRNGVTSDATSDDSAAMAPNDPSSLSATAVNPGEIDLTWTDNSSHSQSYALFRNGTYFTSVSNTGGSSSKSYHDTGLVDGTYYYYAVQTYGVDSVYSSSVGGASDTTPVAPPTGFSAFGLDGAVSLSWTNASQTATMFSIEQYNGSGYSSIGTTGSNYYSVNGLAFGSNYTFRVVAQYGFLSSAGSAADSATTTIPTPSGLSASPVSSSEIDLTWYSITGAYFTVERSMDNMTWTTLSNSVSSAYYYDTSLSSSTLYYYRVRTNATYGSATGSAATASNTTY